MTKQNEAAMIVRTIYKKKDNTFIDDGSLLSCIMHFDEMGVYIGQEQLNVIGDVDEPPTLFFKARGNEAGWLSLSEEEMKEAIQLEE